VIGLRYAIYVRTAPSRDFIADRIRISSVQEVIAYTHKTIQVDGVTTTERDTNTFLRKLRRK
jgi:hypothetical protein